MRSEGVQVVYALNPMMYSVVAILVIEALEYLAYCR